MLSLKKVNPLLLGLIILMVARYLSHYLFPDQEAFLGRVCRGAQCPSSHGADGICHTIASGNCQIPQPQLNDCWLNAYRGCVDGCRNDGGQVCDCADQASMKCQGRRCDDPALACYASVHQKCMAGMGFGVDPDRGRGDAQW